tara:strand:- start:30 stop:224 length:195 start_codon:yes stop_codon:yes gene_type:complete
MNKLTQKEMIKIIKEGKISKQPREIRDQICSFAFGKDFMKQDQDQKGTLQEYQDDLHFSTHQSN